MGLSHILNNIKTFIGVFSLCVIVVTNHFFRIFNTFHIPNFVNTIYIYGTNFSQSGPILIIFQPSILVIVRNVFHAINGAVYGSRESQII